MLVFRHLALDAHVVGIDGHMVVHKLSRDRHLNLSYDHSQALRRLIGVQRQPFYANAWAEAQGHVVGGAPPRREQLAVIFETPA